MSDFYEQVHALDAIQQTYKALDEALISIRGKEPTLIDRLNVYNRMLAVRMAIFGTHKPPGIAKDPDPEDIKAGRVGNVIAGPWL